MTIQGKVSDQWEYYRGTVSDFSLWVEKSNYNHLSDNETFHEYILVGGTITWQLTCREDFAAKSCCKANKKTTIKEAVVACFFMLPPQFDIYLYYSKPLLLWSIYDECVYETLVCDHLNESLLSSTFMSHCLYNYNLPYEICCFLASFYKTQNHFFSLVLVIETWTWEG